MPPEMFRKVNGYSLQYFGWGGEDDDMGKRYDMIIQHHPTQNRNRLQVCADISQHLSSGIASYGALGARAPFILLSYCSYKIYVSCNYVLGRL